MFAYLYRLRGLRLPLPPPHGPPRPLHHTGQLREPLLPPPGLPRPHPRPRRRQYVPRTRSPPAPRLTSPSRPHQVRRGPQAHSRKVPLRLHPLLPVAPHALPLLSLVPRRGPHRRPLAQASRQGLLGHRRARVPVQNHPPKTHPGLQHRKLPRLPCLLAFRSE